MGVQQLALCLLHMGISQMPNLQGPKVATRALNMRINTEELRQFFYTANNLKILFLVSSCLSAFTGFIHRDSDYLQHVVKHLKSPLSSFTLSFQSSLQIKEGADWEVSWIQKVKVSSLNKYYHFCENLIKCLMSDNMVCSLKKKTCCSFWCIPTFWYIQLTYHHFRQAFPHQVTTDFFSQWRKILLCLYWKKNLYECVITPGVFSKEKLSGLELS